MPCRKVYSQSQQQTGLRAGRKVYYLGEKRTICLTLANHRHCLSFKHLLMVTSFSYTIAPFQCYFHLLFFNHYSSVCTSGTSFFSFGCGSSSCCFVRALYILNVLPGFLTLHCLSCLSFKCAPGIFCCTEIFHFYVVTPGLVDYLNSPSSVSVTCLTWLSLEGFVSVLGKQVYDPVFLSQWDPFRAAHRLR